MANDDVTHYAMASTILKKIIDSAMRIELTLRYIWTEHYSCGSFKDVKITTGPQPQHRTKLK